MIKVQNLSCRYDDELVLDNVSFELASHLSIVGSNGSGKSSFAKALCGLIPFEGSITINGKDVSSMSRKEHAKCINYIPSKLQSYDSFTTLREFVLLARYPHITFFEGFTQAAEKKVDEVLAYLNITHLQEKYLQELSSGEQQLTLIGAALVQESEIIIFDEPTANLDPQNSVVFYRILKELQERHHVMLITHDLALAKACNTSSVLHMQKKGYTFYEHGHDFFSAENLQSVYEGSVSYKNSIGIDYD